VTMELSEAQLKAATDARGAVTGVRIDQLKEAYERSKVAYKEAQDKAPFLIQEPYENGVLVKPIVIATPIAGRILQVHVSAGQYVQAGEPLWTIADWTTLWLRVPLFETDFQRIPSDQPAELRDRTTGAVIQADPVSAPTETKTATRTVDRHFAVPNP